MIQSWTPDADAPKQESTCALAVRRYFERLPRMRALILQQKERIADLKNAATTTTSSVSGASGHSGVSDKVGNNTDAAMDAEKHLQKMKCQYAEMQKEAIDFAYLLNADPASIKRSRCITLCYVEGKTRAVAAGEVGYSNARTVSTAISEGFRQLAEIWADTPFCDFDSFAQ
nr:MAG TPA: hypothetical protein [Siphoviridae sp. ctAeS79]